MTILHAERTMSRQSRPAHAASRRPMAGVELAAGVVLRSRGSSAFGGKPENIFSF